ncbi:MAG: OmpA family protein, partial [Bacteroidota bacterium]
MKLLSTLLLLVLALPVLAQSTTREIRQSLYFASASAELDATAQAELVAFTDNLLAYADYGLSVEAYTDEQGTDAYNESLARLRAVTVEAALSDLLVQTTATEVLTYGE